MLTPLPPRSNRPARPARPAFLLSQVGSFSSARFAERVQELGLTASEAGVLRFVARSPGSSQRALADRIGSAPSRVVFLIDSLETRGLLERRRGSADRRNQELWLTPAGDATLGQLRQLAEEHETEILGSLTSDQVTQLSALLTSIAEDHHLDHDLHAGT